MYGLPGVRAPSCRALGSLLHAKWRQMKIGIAMARREMLRIVGIGASARGIMVISTTGPICRLVGHGRNTRRPRRGGQMAWPVAVQAKRADGNRRRLVALSLHRAPGQPRAAKPWASAACRHRVLSSTSASARCGMKLSSSAAFARNHAAEERRILKHVAEGKNGKPSKARAANAIKNGVSLRLWHCGVILLARKLDARRPAARKLAGAVLTRCVTMCGL